MKTRFIKSITTTASQTATPMPWTRGTVRAAFIAKRKQPEPQRKSA